MMIRAKLPLVLVVALFGCDGRDSPCEQIADEIRGKLEDCGVSFVNYHDDLGKQCTDGLEAIEECYRDCYAQASCAGLVDYSSNAHESFLSCMDDCT